MSKLIGYMVTWTTYGTWFQGDKRGYVKKGKILDGDEIILEICRKQQKGQTIRLCEQEKETVKEAILKEASRIDHQIKAIVICTNHVHIAALPCNESIERIVNRYKNFVTRALRETGRTGKIWSKGFDKRFCFNENDLNRKIRYIENHK